MPAGEGVAGGLVAGDDQQDEEDEQLVVGQSALDVAGRCSSSTPGGALCSSGDEDAVVVGLGEDADEVVGDRLAPALGDELDAHRGVLAERGGGGEQRGVVGVGVAVAGHHGVGPAVHLQALLGVEAHELADDDERHVDGEVLDEVDLAPLGDVVDELAGELAHVAVSSRTRAGVKPWLMRRRVRVCSSSSRVMIDSRTSSTGRTPWAEEYSSVWREMWKTSSCFDTTHRSLRSSQCSGSLVRSHR